MTCPPCNQPAPVDHLHDDHPRGIRWRVAACPDCGRAYAHPTALTTATRLETAA